MKLILIKFQEAWKFQEFCIFLSFAFASNILIFGKHAFVTPGTKCDFCNLSPRFQLITEVWMVKQIQWLSK